MKSDKYRLYIRNDKIILKEDVSQMGFEPFQKLAGLVGSTLKMGENTLNSLLNTFTFAVGTIVTMGSSEEVKQRINDRFENRQKKISEKYDSILGDLKLEKGQELGEFLFSPGLYAYEKVKGNIDKSGLIGSHILEIAADPQEYFIQAIPNLKSAFFGDEPKTKKEFADLYKDYREVNRQSKILDQLKKLNKEGNLQKMLEDRTIDPEQKRSIQNLIDYLNKNESVKHYRSSTLKIGKTLILEKEELSKDEILKLVQQYYSETLLKLFKKYSEKYEDIARKKIKIDNKPLAEFIKSNFEIIRYWQTVEKIQSLFIAFLTSLQNSITSNSVNGIAEYINQFDSQIEKIESANVSDVFADVTRKGIEAIKGCVEGFKPILKGSNKEEVVQAIKQFASSKKEDLKAQINSLKEQMVNNKKAVSEGGYVRKGFKRFVEQSEDYIEKGVIKSLIEEKLLTSESEEVFKKKLQEGLSSLRDVETSFSELLTNSNGLINFFSSLKVDSKNNETE